MNDPASLPAHEQIAHLLRERLAALQQPHDARLIGEVAAAFNGLAAHWPGGGFELRPDQLAFAYLAAAEGLAALAGRPTPLALGMGCGEGKQDALAVALALTWRAALAAGKSGTTKLLFVTSTPELVAQMAASPALEGLGAHLHRRDGDKALGARAGIHLLDARTLLDAELDAQEGKPAPLLDDVTKVWLDEVQAFLNASPTIRAPGSNLVARLLREDPAAVRAADEDLALLGALQGRIARLMRRNPARTGFGASRRLRRFNPQGETARCGRSLQEAMRLRLALRHHTALQRLGADFAEGFAALCDLIATHLTRRPGRDYYLHRDARGLLAGYSLADAANGQPLPNTRHADRRAAALTALRHAAHPSHRKGEETSLLREIWLHRPHTEAAPADLLRRLGAARWLLASATLQPVAGALDHFGFARIALQDETVLDPRDPAVLLGLGAAEDSASLAQLAARLAAQNGGALPEQIILTSRDAAHLNELAAALACLAPEHPLAEREIRLAAHAGTAPDAHRFARELEALRLAIQAGPQRPRLALVQGLGEGSNLLGCNGTDYCAAVVKLDLCGIDRLTHTRWRVGARGRAAGVFAQWVDADSTRLDDVTAAEQRRLAQAQNGDERAAALLDIQRAMLAEQADEAMVRLSAAEERADENRAWPLLLLMTIGGLEKMLGFGRKYKTEHEERIDNSRRDFLKSASKGALTLGLTGTGFLKSEEAHAYFEMKNLPPGIQIIKDEALVQAYGSMIYGGYNESRIYNILTRTGGWVEGNMKTETPLIEPGYWFIICHYNYRFQSQGNDGVMGMNRGVEKFSKLIKNNNIPLYNWSIGIRKYFETWADGVYSKKYASPQETETYLFKAIFTAAGHGEGEAEDCQKLDLDGKEAKLKELMADFERLGAEMNRKRESNTKQRADAEKKRSDEAKTLDKQIFILEKRLQREKLSYNKEYDLTQELKQLKARQQALVQGGTNQQSQSEETKPSEEYTRLLIASWAHMFLFIHYGENTDGWNRIRRIYSNFASINGFPDVRGLWPSYLFH